MEKSLTLYYHPASTYCTKVRFFLEEADFLYQKLSVDLAKSEQLASGFREDFATRKVPAIKIGDLRLTESNTILRYLCDRFQLFEYYPVNLEERAIVDQWLEFTHQHVCKYIGELAWYRHWGPSLKFTVSNVLDTTAEKNFHYYMPVIERRLTTSQYIGGSFLSIADFSLAAFLDLCPLAKIRLQAYPFAHEYAERMFAKPSWRTLASEI